MSDLATLMGEIRAGQGLKLGDAARQFGKNPSTLYRWAVQGTRRRDGSLVRLATIRVGHRMVTTERALMEYMEAMNAGPESAGAPEVRTPTQRQKAAAKANAELEAAGM